MQPFHNIPLGQKLTVMLLLASVSALLLASVAFFAVEWFSLKNHLEEDARTMTKVVAAAASPLLSENNGTGAREVLQSLSREQGILHASFEGTKGEAIASSDAPGFDGRALLREAPAGISYQGGYLILRDPILQNGKNLGTTSLVYDFKHVRRRLITFHSIATLLILAIAIGVTFLISSRAQKVVSAPILELLKTAKGITENQDYGRRAPEGGNDEIGAFSRAFNGMLEDIQIQEAALQKAPEELHKKVQALEHEISERSRIEENLRAAEMKYRTLVEQLPVITYNAETNNSGAWFYVSPQIEAIMGYTQKEWVGNAQVWQERLHSDDVEIFNAKAEMMDRNGDQFICEYRLYDRFGRMHWFRDQSAVVRDPVENKAYTHGFLLDVTEQKQAEMELDTLQLQLLDISRQAGMAEVATGVLHNVGNVLNSVNVSSTILGDIIRNSKQASLAKVTALLREHSGDLGKYISSDAKGKLLPTYLISLTEHLSEEHVDMINELEMLIKNVEHIKDIVSMQQSYAKVSGMIESISPLDMVEDALQINAPSFSRNGIKVVKDCGKDIPLVAVEKHKVLQILVNLLRNARSAMEEVPRKDRQIALAVHLDGNNKVQIRIADRGCGIAPENLTRIFSHGFTTKSDGHGFGLHIGALAAQEMGGSLQAESDGPGKGAVFILELPIVKTLS